MRQFVIRASNRNNETHTNGTEKQNIKLELIFETGPSMILVGGTARIGDLNITNETVHDGLITRAIVTWEEKVLTETLYRYGELVNIEPKEYNAFSIIWNAISLGQIFEKVIYGIEL